VIYKSIADRLRLRLNSSDYNIGSPLPGEKALAQEFGVARMTIRKALDLLVSWGLVERRTAAARLWRAKTSTMKPPT
jgi:GntR family glv operon transcriptional regulator